MKKPAKQLRRINEPYPRRVSSDANHHPIGVHIDGERLPVASIHDMWIVEDEWWREPPVDRQYFKVVLEGGQIMTLFWDRHADRWYEQDYTHPEDIGVDPGGSWD